MQEEIKKSLACEWYFGFDWVAQTVVPNKWVYKIKIVDGRPKYKATLVAKGYAQKEGIDFQEVFSPVAKMTTLCVLVALITALVWNYSKWMLKQPFCMVI